MAEVPRSTRESQTAVQSVWCGALSNFSPEQLVSHAAQQFVAGLGSVPGEWCRRARLTCG